MEPNPRLRDDAALVLDWLERRPPDAYRTNVPVRRAMRRLAEAALAETVVQNGAYWINLRDGPPDVQAFPREREKDRLTDGSLANAEDRPDIEGSPV